MSPENLKRRKLKEKNKETLEIIKEQKTLEKRKSKLGLEKKKRGDKVDGIDHEKEKKSQLGLKKRRRREKGNEVDASKEDQIHEDEHADNGMMCPGGLSNSDHVKSSTRSQTLNEKGNSEKPKEASNQTKIKIKKVTKEMNRKKKDFHIANERKIEETLGEVDEGKGEEIPLVDKDYSKGLKKWLIKYKECRPSLKILQQRIDDFITAYEEQQEEERKEREARAAEGGWTVVTHHRGRKKTTDTESGVTVGSVAQAAVEDKMRKKKSKEVPLDFYRFQKREAQRNEVMLLRSKFEQDKKRIQQLRSARKFRPY